MTPSEIRAAIAASPELTALAESGNVQAIADALSVGRTRVTQHFASERGILERLPAGPVAADELLAKLEAFALTAHPYARIVGRALKFLAQPEGLDIGSPATMGLLAQLQAGGVISADELAGLTAMATVADPIVREQVTEAIYG